MPRFDISPRIDIGDRFEYCANTNAVHLFASLQTTILLSELIFYILGLSARPLKKESDRG